MQAIHNSQARQYGSVATNRMTMKVRTEKKTGRTQGKFDNSRPATEVRDPRMD